MGALGKTNIVTINIIGQIQETFRSKIDRSLKTMGVKSGADKNF